MFKIKSTQPSGTVVAPRRRTIIAVLKRFATVAIGLAVMVSGVYVYSFGDAQTSYYNQGIAAYAAASVAGQPGSPIHSEAEMKRTLGQARQMFERSRQAYKANSVGGPWLKRFLSPQPDQHLAAMAAFQEAKCYLVLGQANLAVKSFQTYLQINPGGSADEHIEDTLVDQYDLEMLLKANPSAGSGQGQGSGNDPSKGSQPGKNTPTKI